ncbi:biotin/lipoyl-containing protein, partial [Streptomyces sp. NPDC051776]|uniref:biotin/lipoyl-containing protein n=1 Tax=Streptomyces sp. NPDC051776 TaxID=3155414 RepID=UPI00342FDCDC
GEELGYTDPPVRGHSFEFRINGEDPGRNFLPTPGRVTVFEPPTGPGVRLDPGVEAGTVIGPAWDSLLAKLIVSGATRQQALQRAARALAELRVEGLPTVLPFHRAVVEDPAFAPEPGGSAGPFTIHTRWIETEFAGGIEPFTAPVGDTGGEAGEAGSGTREHLVVEVGSKRLEVSFPEGLATLAAAAAAVAPLPEAPPPPRRLPAGKTRSALSGFALASPMQGTIVKVAVEEGQYVNEGDLVVVLEAMKTEQPLSAHCSGVVKDLTAEVGACVTSGAVICEIRN